MAADREAVMDDFDDLEWMNDPVLAALDAELDPMPSEWETEIVADFLEGWRALERGGEVNDVMAGPPDTAILIRLMSDRRDRYKRLCELEAPYNLRCDASALHWKTVAQYAWRRMNELHGLRDAWERTYRADQEQERRRTVLEEGDKPEDPPGLQ